MNRNYKWIYLLLFIISALFSLFCLLIKLYLFSSSNILALCIEWILGIMMIFLVGVALIKIKRGELFAKYFTMTIFLTVSLQILSLLASPQITYAKFGITVYGLLPIPIFDLTINSSGWPKLRNKSHLIKKIEIEDALTSDVEIFIVAKGWDSIARVDKEILKMTQVKIEILDTKKAFQRYNELKRQGIRVAILAHTTC